MTCIDIQAAIHGYLDGELDAVRDLEIEQHLQHCAVCSQTYNADQSLQRAIKRALSIIALRRISGNAFGLLFVKLERVNGPFR